MNQKQRYSALHEVPGKYPDHPNCFLQQAGGGKSMTTQSQKTIE